MEEKIFSNCWIKWSVVSSFVALSLFLLVKVGTDIKTFNQAGDEIPSNTITLSGTGKVFAVADIANFSFAVDETANTVVGAQKLATDKNNKALDYLKLQGINDKDIQATGYNVSPKYDYNTRPCVVPMSAQSSSGVAGATISPAPSIVCPPSGPKLVGYEVTESINVKVRDITKAGTILAGIGSLNVTNISGLSFTIDNDKDLKTQARKMAIDDAKAQATKLANDLGVRLGKVTSFSENGASPVFYSAKAMSVGAGDSAATAPQLPAGQNEIDSNVSITYQIK
ncbi:MAG: SIMPL domain-containing protein [bacterium]